MGISAKLVWDTELNNVIIPSEMGIPRKDQMQGTIAEQLSELAGRVCYDSVGTGRPSFDQEGKEGYHTHILNSGHGSVLEHFNFTISVPTYNISTFELMELFGRPGIWIDIISSGQIVGQPSYFITMNLRCIVDWYKFPPKLHKQIYEKLYNTFSEVGSRLAPNIIKSPPKNELYPFELIKTPNTDNQKWISLFLSGSRGFSHEQVRHGDFTGISQRSTRFVDESESEWVKHPLIKKYEQETGDILSSPEPVAKICYIDSVNKLQNWLLSKNIDKITCRKQARGAARGYLGNALYTEMIFSANISQWKRMFLQRLNSAADAEIREVFECILHELKKSSYADCFSNFELIDSADGIGKVLK